MKPPYTAFPKALKKELILTGGSVLLLFLILTVCISFIWVSGIITQARDQNRQDLHAIAHSLNTLLSNAESHVYRMKAHLEKKKSKTEPLLFIGSAPFDSDSSVPFSLFQNSTVRSDTSSHLDEALSLYEVAFSTHATDSSYQWSYYYDVSETYSTVYPKQYSKNLMKTTNTSTIDAMIAEIFSAGGVYPMTMVSPKKNPERKLIWTVPYTDPSGMGLLVSILAPLYQNNQFIGAVGTDITLKKMLAFIKSQNTGIMNIEITDGTGKTIVTTSSTKKHRHFDRFSEKLSVEGWSITAEVELVPFCKSIAPELIIPLVIVVISLVAFTILSVLFLRRFVYPSLALAGFIEASGKTGAIIPIQSIPSVWREFFQQVTDSLAERAKLTEQLHQSQKMEAVGQLAGGIAHDFNNALGGIIGATELLKEGGLSPEDEQEFLDLILTAGERAGELTKQLLLFSRKGKKASAAIDCAKIVSETALLLKHTINKNIVISVNNHSTNSTIIGDSSLIQNTIMNIGINASHAMSKGGELIFTLENLELDEEYCDLSPFEVKPGNYLEISIRDTGSGMSTEIQSHIFEPFFTTKEAGKGTGLGMAAVYGTIQEHGGAITVYSEVGVGTVFHLYLPVSSEIVFVPQSLDRISQGAGTILVIDDEELIRITASMLLVNLGYKVILATNGREGIETFIETKEQIDLIILDMIMPVMGGRETFERIREIDPTIPVIIASGFAKDEDMAALKTQGASGFLHKPFRRAELAEMVAGVTATIPENKGILS